MTQQGQGIISKLFPRLLFSFLSSFLYFSSPSSFYSLLFTEAGQVASNAQHFPAFPRAPSVAFPFSLVRTNYNNCDKSPLLMAGV